MIYDVCLWRCWRFEGVLWVSPYFEDVYDGCIWKCWISGDVLQVSPYFEEL